MEGSLFIKLIKFNFPASSTLASSSLLLVLLATSSLTCISAQPFGFLTWNTADGLPQSQVSALAEDARGFIWAGTQGGGVARFDGREFRTYTMADGLPDNFVTRLWIDGEQLVAETKSGQATFDYATDRWGGTFVSQPSIRTFERWETVVSSPVAALRSPDGKYLVASRSNGLYLIGADQKTILRHYTEASSDLPHNSVRALLKDRQGRFWLGTSGGGLTRMIATGIRHYDRSDGLVGDRVYALHEGPDRLWIGASKTGIQYLDSTGFQRPVVDDPTVGTKITSITQAPDGKRTYFSTDGRGIAVLDDSLRVKRLTVRDGLPSNWIMKLFSGNRPGGEEVWAVTYTDGIARIVYRDSAYRVMNYQLSEENRPLRLTSALSVNDNKVFFLGTKEGRIHVWRWREEELTMKTTVLGPDNGLPAAPIKAMALRRETQLWVAVAGYGLYYTDLRMEKVRFFPLPPRLQTSTNIFQLTAPPDKPEVWIGTEKGVDRLLLNSDGQPDVIRAYGRAEGFVGGETTGASVIDSDGNIWFGTMNGLARYEETEPEGFLAPPPVFLEGIDVFYTPLDSVDVAYKDLTHPRLNRDSLRLRLRARQNHLNFRFRAVDLTYPERIRYRYKLSGTGGIDWSPLTKETAVRFAGLAPGTHAFTVAATTDSGKTFGEEAVFEFVVESPLLRQTWFQGLLTLLGTALLIGGFYFFYRRIQRREAVLRQQLEARNQVLELEQKALRLQMNPHFIFNALNGIRGLVDGEHDREAREQITRFATLMRGILNNSRQEQITLTEEVNVLENYLKMEQFCQPFPFTFSIDVTDDLDPEEVTLPPMLLQPFVENAVLHGLSGKDGAGHINVHFSGRGRRMRCLVEDNGIGRTASAQRQQSRAPGHKSVALDVTRARLKAMKGSLKISDGVGGGTVVEVVVPVERW